MQGTPKAIEIKGIVRNATVIGAQDGQAEDLINLRFMDGSWRASGDGRLINFTMGAEYTQLYVHTNVYHHLLGVDNGTLYWFASIASDGVTFYPLDNTTSRTSWPTEFQSLPTAPVALTTVHGDLWITQTGHLLTVIDGEDDFEYFVFKTGTKEYVTVNMDVNGKATNRSLYPFGQAHFNWYSSLDAEGETIGVLQQNNEPVDWAAAIDAIENAYWIRYTGIDVQEDNDKKQIAQSFLIKTLSAFTRMNKFTMPFLACTALRSYDGSFTLASQPQLITPRECGFGDFFYEYRFNVPPGEDSKSDNKFDITFQTHTRASDKGPILFLRNGILFERDRLIDIDASNDDTANNVSIALYDDPRAGHRAFSVRRHHLPSFSFDCVIGSDLTLNVSDTSILKDNPDVFKSLCIFITPQVPIFGTSAEDYKKLEVFSTSQSWGSKTITNKTYKPSFRERSEIIFDLIHSPFFLLREYSISELQELESNPIVNLTQPQYKGVLPNITQQQTLPTESWSRTTYLPKVSYMYNNRLHIANYKSYPFFGYPIDCFHLHNHSVKVQANNYFKGVLPNLADNNDSYLQYAKTDHAFPVSYSNAITYFAYIEVEIETSQGMQKVVRYIEPYAISSAVDGRADFIESLNPLLTYPDARAKKMTIYILKEETTYQGGAMFMYYTKTVDLKPHPYLNIAYHIDPDLKPIEFSTSPVPNNPHALPTMQNTEEYFPNGLKVSKADQPMFFPVENTYQVGSAEILALMSNTIAVGTGQTGAAPLYVFCKDGVYALFVDASGQITYSNSRVLARDVCNNPRSVTPIDAGVVFTTDRGLMMIAGEQVEEIGQPAEGDVVQYVDSTKVDYSKYAFDALTKIAGLPSSLCDTTDFLTYLQDKGTLGKAAIVNYNHNMRELIISNPNYAYSYVLDRVGNWSRRDYTASEYVNNYPTSYRVTSGGQFCKLDDEGDASTSLEHRKEADNQIFYLSNVIKLDSIGFKQAYRFVVRGYFETINPYYWQEVGQLEITGSKPSQDMLILDATTYAALEVGDLVRIKTNGIQEVSVTGKYANNLVQFSEALDAYSYSGQFIFIKRFAVDPAPNVGIVVEGSYDGIKFAPLGFNRKSGKFTNIGCHVSHTDVRFYRVILCGQVTGKTRIDYMELSANGSVLNTKIR